MFSQFKFFRSKTSKLILVIAFILFLVSLSSIWALSQLKQAFSWHRANSIAPIELVRTAVQQNSLVGQPENTLDENQLKAIKIPSQGAGTLYIFDFNTPQLCGTGGCLYTVYTSQGKPVLRLLLNPKLPRGTTLFSISEETRNRFPCLVVAQSAEKGEVSRSRYCYEGSGFARVNFSQEGV